MNKQFDIDIEMTATIGPETANRIIVSAVERQTGRQVSDVRVKYDGDKFDGYYITFDPKLKSLHNFKPSKEFIVNNFDDN
jgi:hypothetical protein